MRTRTVFVLLGVITALTLVAAMSCGDDETDAPTNTAAPSATDAPEETDEPAENNVNPTGVYDPQIDPADFTTEINNPFFSLPVGKKMVYEGEVDGGLERIEIEIESETKTILGVETIVYRDRVYVDGVLAEDTRDYLAQDKDGNVWYFGEDVDNYVNGELANHAGSFIAGEDGAKPGIWMKAEQRVGDSYRQEYYAGKAEDIRDVVAVDQTVTTELKTYSGCVQTFDWSPLDPESREHKYHCPEPATSVLLEDLESGESVELVEVTIP